MSATLWPMNMTVEEYLPLEEIQAQLTGTTPLRGEPVHSHAEYGSSIIPASNHKHRRHKAGNPWNPRLKIQVYSSYRKLNHVFQEVL